MLRNKYTRAEGLPGWGVWWMGQIVFARSGARDGLVAGAAPTLTPAAGELRIAVRAAGVNFADVMARLGLYPDAPKPPLVTGYEVAGVVEDTGKGVTRVHQGDRVIAITKLGGYSSPVVVPQTFVFRPPDQISD